MAYSNTAEIVAKVKSDLRDAVDTEEILTWLDDVQEDLVADLQIPTIEAVTTFTSTDDQLTYTVSDIATNILQIREIFLRLSTSTAPSNDYNVATSFQKKYFGFKQRELYVELSTDPQGDDLTVVYYKKPTPITTTIIEPSIPLRWRRGLYIGMMSMASEMELKTPSGNWETLYENYKEKIRKQNKTQNKGANRLEYYGI